MKRPVVVSSNEFKIGG